MGFELITTEIVTILKCVECGAGAPPFASIEQAEAAHKKGCARRGCAVPSSVWDYSPACVREREQQLLETLDVFAVRDSESMKGAASLARRGWDAASSLRKWSAPSARVVTVTAGRRGRRAPVAGVQGRKLGPTAERRPCLGGQVKASTHRTGATLNVPTRGGPRTLNRHAHVVEAVHCDVETRLRQVSRF